MRYKTKQRMLQVLVKLLPVSKRKPRKGKRSFCASISIPKWSGGLGRRSLGSGANNFTHDSSSRVAAAPKTGDLERKRGVLHRVRKWVVAPHRVLHNLYLSWVWLIVKPCPKKDKFWAHFFKNLPFENFHNRSAVTYLWKNILEANICLKEKQDQNINLGVLLGLQRGDRPQLLSKESRLGAAQIPQTREGVAPRVQICPRASLGFIGKK